ncbi:MAG: ferrous iron transport protein A [Xenococcaceae cyanobacterium]
MDYQPKKRQKQHRKRQGWGFTFFGETPNPDEEEESQIAIAPELANREVIAEQSFFLGTSRIGHRVKVVGFRGKGGINRLLSLGLIPGTEVQVISCTREGSVIVTVGDNRIGLGAGMAQRILVTDNRASIKRNEQQMKTNRSTFLRDMPVGARGRVVGYEKAYRGYKGKLLSMGLTPGTEFTVIRHAPLGDPVEIEVRGFKLSLRKQEANALCVEEVDNE